MIRKLRALWHEMTNWTECYPIGWRSIYGIGMTHEECNQLHEFEFEMIERERAEAKKLASRPDFV